MVAGRRFQFRPVLTLCAGLGLAVLIALGVWQLHRLEWKQALIAKIEARVAEAPIPFEKAFARAEAGEDMEYTPVSLSGRIGLPDLAFVFGTYNSEAGGFVFAPVTSRTGDIIYVNLGFMPQRVLTEGDRTAHIEDGPDIAFEGLFRYPEKPAPPASWFRPTGQSVDGLWFTRDPAQFAEAAGHAAPGYYIDRFAVEGADWPKGGSTRLEFRNNHLDYALTWFGLAAVLLAVWLILSLPKKVSSNNFEK